MAAICKRCLRKIEFKPHPRNPAKLVPFDLDGEIHFATCKDSHPQKVGPKSWDDLPKCPKGHSLKWLFKRFYPAAGLRIIGTCIFGHQRFIQHTADADLLINCKEHQELDWPDEQRWQYIKDNISSLNEWGQNFVKSNIDKQFCQLSIRQKSVLLSLWSRVTGGQWSSLQSLFTPEFYQDRYDNSYS